MAAEQVMLRVKVSGQHVMVYHGDQQVYQIEPDGESWDSRWYERGQQAVIDAAKQQPGNPVLQRWAREIKDNLR